MTTRYEIEGNEVRRFEITQQRSVNLPEFLSRLTSYVPVSLSPMPRGIQYLSVDPTADGKMTTRVLCQVDPHVERINFKNGSASSHATIKNYPIMLPYMLFFFVLSSEQMFSATGSQIVWSPKHWGVFWTNTPYTGLDTPVRGAAMPNCHPNGAICFGSTNVAATQHFGQFIDTAINTFFQSQFNMDLTYPWPYDSMNKWAKATEQDPTAWMEWPLWQADMAPISLHLATGRHGGTDGNWREPQPSSLTDEIIPPMPQAPTFHAIANWLAELSPDAINRLRAGLEHTDDTH